ncbi:MAG: hypothetical protein KatS3mg051_0300 [Anaerolineae bacterium]|nr:MAG: hypothetical protein KatS3mg051_0300 [Anaerolineae bacterium]
MSNQHEQQGVHALVHRSCRARARRPCATALEKELRARGLKVERLDGDTVRKSLTRDLGFSKEDRDKNIERVTFVAKLLSRNGVAVLAAFISPYRATVRWCAPRRPTSSKSTSTHR